MLPSFLPMSERRHLLKTAMRLMTGARQVVLGKLARGFKTSLKADKTYVTDVDRAVERYLRREITRLFPDHGIIGEEFGQLRPDSPFQWILDPIDGTLSLTHGIPLYGIILALHHRDAPLLGVIDHPGLGERVSGARGMGAFLNGRKINIKDLSPGERIASEIIATGDRTNFIKCAKADRLDALNRRHPIIRSYADCFGHTLAARGSVGAMIDFGVRLWDIAATQVIIEEAGGKYVCCQFSRQSSEHRGQTLAKPGGVVLYNVIFGKPKVVDWILPFFAHD